MPTKGTVLLAGDEDGFIEATQAFLEENGLACHSVRKVQDLTKAIATVEFNLIIMDFTLPGNRGLAVVEDVRAQTNILPVIVVTGYPSLQSAVESVRLNVLEYLIKPIDFPRLLEVVKKGIHHNHVLDAVQKARQEAGQRVSQLAEIAETLRIFGEIVHLQPDTGHTSDPTSKGLQLQVPMVTQPLEASPNGSSACLKTPQPFPKTLMGTQYYKLREGIYETIHVLQKTKSAFRSTDLASLRLKLEKLLKEC